MIDTAKPQGTRVEVFKAEHNDVTRQILNQKSKVAQVFERYLLRFVRFIERQLYCLQDLIIRITVKIAEPKTQSAQSDQTLPEGTSKIYKLFFKTKCDLATSLKKTCSGSVELDLFYLPFGLGKAVFKKNHKQLDQVIHRIEEDPYLNQIAARYLYRLHTKENALEKSLAESENPLQEVQKTTKRYLKDSLSKALNSGMCYGRVFSILMDINSETNISAETILQSSKKVERIFYQLVFQTLHKDPKYPGKKILDPTLFDYDIQEEPLFKDVNISKNLETLKTLLEKELNTDHTFFIVHYGSKNKGGHVACICKNATNQYFYYDSIDDFDGGIFQANNKQAFICGLSRKILSFRQGFLSPRFEEFMICRAYNPKKNFNFNL